jgi:hypothetical protein
MYKSFGILFLVSGLLLSGPCVWSIIRQGPAVQGDRKSGDQRNSGQDLHGRLHSVFSGNGKASDGTFLEMNSYETPSGTRVGITRGKFPSPAAAQREFRHWLKQARRVIEERTNKDPSGHSIGLRAIGIFPSVEPQGENSAVLWTDGDKYFWVSSPSLELALQVEEELKSHSSHQKIELSH